MRKIALGLSLVLLAATISSGCNRAEVKRKKENLEPPAELTEFSPSVTVNKLWSFDAGKGAGKTGTSPRATLSADQVYVADTESGLTALSGVSGTKIWQAEIDAKLSSNIGVGEGLVLVGSLDGELIALDALSGSEKWRAVVSSEVIAAPAIQDGLVAVRAHDGRLYGFEAKTGARKWVFDRSLPTITLRGNGTPIIKDGRVFVGYDNGKFYSIDANDGSLKWEQTLSSGEGRFELDRINDVDGDLALVNGVLYATAYRGRVTAMQPDTGRAVWDRDLSSFGGVTSDGNKVVVADIDGAVSALEASSGASLWRNDVLKHRWLTTPVIMGQYVLVGDFEGVVHWFSLDDGKLAARVNLGGSAAIRGTPQVANDVVYITNVDGETSAFRLGNGTNE